jgi:hypothetical protein
VGFEPTISVLERARTVKQETCLDRLSFEPWSFYYNVRVRNQSTAEFVKKERARWGNDERFLLIFFGVAFHTGTHQESASYVYFVGRKITKW